MRISDWSFRRVLFRALERHSQRAYDALFSERLGQFETRWTAVAEHADPELRGSVQHWIDRARGTEAEHLRAVAARASREQAAADAAAQDRKSTRLNSSH